MSKHDPFVFLKMVYSELSELTIKTVSLIAGIDSRLLQKQAQRKGWPHRAVKIGGGKPLYIYDMRTLPDDLQKAWAEKISIDSVDAVQKALGWEARGEYYKKIRKGKGRPSFYWSGSGGLCPEAREILINRFGKELGAIPEAGSTPAEDLRLPEARELVQSPPQTNNPAPKGKMSKELQTENNLLKELLEAKNEMLSMKEEMLRLKEAEISRLTEENKAFQGEITRLEADNQRLAEELAQEKQETKRMEETVCVD